MSEFVIEMSPTIGSLTFALCQAQKEMNFATKDASNPFFKSKYADLASVWACCKGPLTKHSLSVMQFPCGDGDICGLITQLSFSEDTSDEWIRCKFFMKPKDNSPQAMGSCLTYMRRYALSAIVGVIADDDDGHEANQIKAKIEHHSESASPSDIYTGTKIQKIWLLDKFNQKKLSDEQMKKVVINLTGKRMEEVDSVIDHIIYGE